MSNELIHDIIQWDIRNWYTALKYWDNAVTWDNIQTCLELGGREGGLSLWLALKGKNVICSDLREAKMQAQPLHTKYNVTSYIQYQNIDATLIPYENYFDLIAFKSIIGGIGRSSDHQKLQQQVFTQIHKALKPGGKLIFAENAMASPIHQFLRNQFIPWSTYWRYIRLEECHEFLASFSSFQLQTTGILGTFGRTETQKHFLSTLDNLLLNKITPDSWKYIVYGVAQK